MDFKIKQELLMRIKEEPKFLKKVEKRFDLDLDFYRAAVSYNLDCYDFIPLEYQNDDIIIDILLNNASTSHLSFNYNKIVPNNFEQMKKLKNIKINFCYLALYKTILGNGMEINDEIFISSIDSNNRLIFQINDILNCLSDDEKKYIIYRFGLNDGSPKCISICAKRFNTNKSKIIKLDNNIILKIKNIISNSHLSDLGFYDVFSKEENKCKK